MSQRFTKTFAPTALTAALLTWAGPALAQAGTQDGYGYHHGFGGGYHHGWGGMVGGPLLALLFFAAVTVVVVLVARAIMGGRCCHHRRKHGGQGSSALAILEERYAKGEIDTAEFQDRKKALTGD